MFLYYICKQYLVIRFETELETKLQKIMKLIRIFEKKFLKPKQFPTLTYEYYVLKDIKC